MNEILISLGDKEFSIPEELADHISYLQRERLRFKKLVMSILLRDCNPTSAETAEVYRLAREQGSQQVNCQSHPDDNQEGK